jgi:hypothetical protein
MKTPPPALQPQITSPQPLANLQMSARGVRRSVADESNLDQLDARATAFTPQLRALFAESGHAESLLND